MFLISLSYGNSLAFTSTFIFASLIMTSATFTNFNLAKVKLAGIQIPEEMYSQDSSRVKVYLRNESNKARYDLEVSLPGFMQEHPIELLPGETEEVSLVLKDMKRGKYNFTHLRLETSFPIGVFKSWSNLVYPLEFWIFPNLQDSDIEPKFINTEEKSGTEMLSTVLGGDNFQGHKKYENGESWRVIDWKVYSRSRELLSKVYTEDQDGMYLFELQGDKENREEEISLLSGAIKKAELKGARYSLNLNNKIIEGKGREYFLNCMRELGEYE